MWRSPRRRSWRSCRLTSPHPNPPPGRGGTFVNLGCRTNAAESDEVAALLKGARNFVVVNSCTVTTAADRDTRKAVARARRDHPGAALVLMGCFVDAHPGERLGADLVVPNAWKQAPVDVAGPELVEPP